MSKPTKIVEEGYLNKIELMNENMINFIISKHGCKMIKKGKQCVHCDDPNGDVAANCIEDHFSKEV